jgi:succinyl-diaminopimelate desuccinylase
VHTDEYCNLVQTLAGCIEQIGGMKAGFAASPGTYDQKHVVRIANVAQCVAYGPGMLSQAHLPDEYCVIDDIVASAKVMALTAAQLLGIE